MRRKRWQKLEKKEIASLGGESTPASGARPGKKADGVIGLDWRVEHKGTDKESFKLTDKLLRKLEKDCAESGGGTPLFKITFRKVGRKVILFPDYCLQEDMELKEENLPFTVEPYDSNWMLNTSSGKGWVLLSEDIAKSRLGLAES